MTPELSRLAMMSGHTTTSTSTSTISATTFVASGAGTTFYLGNRAPQAYQRSQAFQEYTGLSLYDRKPATSSLAVPKTHPVVGGHPPRGERLVGEGPEIRAKRLQ